MAAVTSNIVPIDPSKSAKYPVTIDESLLSNSESPKIKYTNIRFNHKPSLPTTPTKTTIHSSLTHPNNYTLSLTTATSTSYNYAGAHHPSTEHALIFSPTSQSFNLTRITDTLNFNLRSTPTTRSAKTLSTLYPSLDPTVSSPETSGGEEDLFDDTSSQTGDPDNPYDYRHFLKQHNSPSPEQVPTVPSPPRRQSRSTKPKPRPHRAPRSASPREEADADNEDSDDGGLTIVDDSKPKRRFDAAFNVTSNGPISLRSAASSISPAARLESDSDAASNEDVEDLILEEGSGGVEVGREFHEDEDQEDGDLDEEDEDGEEEDGGLDAEFEQALESQAEGGGGGVDLRRRVQDESEESSEEE
ncbi:hypothetical protein MMC12_003461 [Toensbergia leucococca]|nr:hypothetical protein [Toensbergia leucococca]